MSVTASSLLIYVSMLFCLVSFVTYSEIGLGRLFQLSFTVRIVVCVFFYIGKR